MIVLIVLIGIVSAGDYKFQNKSGSDAVIIHTDTGNLTVIGNISAQTAKFELTELGKIIMDGIITSKDIIPITHNLYSLGNSSNWFSNIYANYIHAANITATFLNSTNIESINISSENIQSNEINTTLSQTKNLTTEGFETYYEDGWTKFKLI